MNQKKGGKIVIEYKESKLEEQNFEQEINR